MKRTISAVFAVVLLVTGCGTTIPPLTLDVKTTAKTIKAESNPVDITTITSGGPLYVFDVDTPNPTLHAFRKLRINRVEELIKMMGKEKDQLKETFDVMPKYRGELIVFFSTLADALDTKIPEQARLKLIALDAIDRYLKASARTVDIYANLEGLSETLASQKMSDTEKNGPVMPMFWYMKYALLQKLSTAMVRELSYSPAKAGALIALIQSDEKMFDEKIQKLAKKFDKKLGKLFNKVNTPFMDALKTQLDLIAGFESLKAADYAFSMAAAEFAKTTVPDIVKKMSAIKTSAATTEDDIQFYNSYAKFMQAWTDTFDKSMSQAIPPPFLKIVKPSKSVQNFIPSFEGVAYAGVRDWLDSAASCLTSGIKGTGDVLYSAASKTANAAFIASDKLSEVTGAKTVFKGAQKIVGAGVSMVDLAVGASMDIAANRYYGNSRKDETAQVAGTITKIFRSWDEGKPGSETLKEGVNMLSAAEETVGSATAAVVAGSFGLAEMAVDTATGGMVQKIPGRETVTWATSGLAQITAGMATGFGKGAMTLANSESTNEELFDGAVDVAFSFVGGSKAVVKGSQAVAGVKELSKDLAEKGANQLRRLELKLESSVAKGMNDDILKAAQKSLSAREIQIVADNERRIAQNMLEKQILERQEKSITKILDDLVAKTDRKIAQNLDDAGTGAKNFVNQGFERSLNGMKKAVGEMTGKTLTDYADNIMGGFVDNAFKGMVKGGFTWLVGSDDKKQLIQSEKIAQEADEIAQTRATDYAKQKLMEAADKEIDKTLSASVTASGSFVGSYKGSVRMTFAPGGGPVSGSVTTKHGTATLSGSVSKNGALSAHVSGGMQYDYYPDGVHAEKRSCSLSANMTGSIGGRRASGTYSGSCAKENDGGSWSVTW